MINRLWILFFVFCCLANPQLCLALNAEEASYLKKITKALSFSISAEADTPRSQVIATLIQKIQKDIQEKKYQFPGLSRELQETPIRAEIVSILEQSLNESPSSMESETETFSMGSPASCLIHANHFAAEPPIAALDKSVKDILQNRTQHGTLNLKDEIEKEGATLISLGDPASSGVASALYHFSIPQIINAEKPLFKEDPHIDHIFQDTSLDCGLLAPLASILATKGGAELIKNMVYEDVAHGKIYVRLYDPKTFKKKIVQMTKARDFSSGLQNSKFTSRSKLWVHMIERAYSSVVQECPTSTSSHGILAQDAFKAILGPRAKEAIVFHAQTGEVEGRPLSKSERESKILTTFEKEMLKGPSVLARNTAAAKLLGLEAAPHGLHLDHYFAVVSGVEVHHGVKGVWLFNTLNRSNSPMGSVFSGPYDRRFFQPLQSLPKIFSNGVAVRHSN